MEAGAPRDRAAEPALERQQAGVGPLSSGLAPLFARLGPPLSVR